jgi:hypothetical protein
MADFPFYQNLLNPLDAVTARAMAGGAGARRGPPNGGPPCPPPNNGNYQGPPPGHPLFNQYNNYPGGPPPPQQYNAPPMNQQQGPPPDKPRSGGFDGPGEPSRGPNPYGPGLGYDPAKPKPVEEKVITNTRIELPASAYKLEGGSVS